MGPDEGRESGDVGDRRDEVCAGARFESVILADAEDVWKGGFARDLERCDTFTARQLQIATFGEVP
jgi:hypothetical protein